MSYSNSTQQQQSESNQMTDNQEYLTSSWLPNPATPSNTYNSNDRGSESPKSINYNSYYNPYYKYFNHSSPVSNSPVSISSGSGYNSYYDSSYLTSSSSSSSYLPSYNNYYGQYPYNNDSWNNYPYPQPSSSSIKVSTDLHKTNNVQSSSTSVSLDYSSYLSYPTNQNNTLDDSLSYVYSNSTDNIKQVSSDQENVIPCTTSSTPSILKKTAEHQSTPNLTNQGRIIPQTNSAITTTSPARNPKQQSKTVARKAMLPDSAVEILNRWYENNINNPYPDINTKEELAIQGGITIKQVNAWFSNRRNRTQNTKPKKIKREMESKLTGIFQELTNHQLSSSSFSSNINYEIIEKVKSLIR